MYQSLYRTWRPQRFSEMVGQDHVVRTLRQQVASGHIAHAYLFSGSRGTGKTSAARILAKAVNCERPEAGDPCLNCQACQSLQSESTLDVFEMDAASNSRVEEIREMLEKVNYPPQFVRRKVYIIDEVHMLSNAAFNALLKTLEEPPDYMIFILATTEPQKLPATILSRCQRFDFGRIDEEAIIGRLKQAIKPDQKAHDAALRLIASAAEGSMRDAWSLMDMCLASGSDLDEARVREALGAVDRGFLFDFAGALAEGRSADAFRLIGQFFRSGKDIQVFFKDLAGHLRRLIACKLDKDSLREASEQTLRRIREQAAGIPLSKLVWMLEKTTQTEAQLRWSSQQRTLLEVFALSICELRDHEEPLALKARLDDVEQALSALQQGGLSMRQPAAQAMAEEPPQAETEAEPESEPEPEPELEKVLSEEPKPEPEPEEVLSEQPELKPEEVPPDEPEPEEAQPEEPEAPALPIEKAAAEPEPAAPLPAGKNPKQVWNAMLERAKKELPSVHSMMNEGRFGGYTEGCYALQYPADKLYLIGFLMEEGRRGMIEKLLSEEQGSPARFEARGESSQSQDLSAKEKAAEDVEALAQLFGRQNVMVQGGQG